MFLTRYKQNKVKNHQSKYAADKNKNDILFQFSGYTALFVCASDGTGRGNHRGPLRRVSPLPAEYFLLFASSFLLGVPDTASLIFRCRRLQKCQQMESVSWNIFQAYLIPGRPSCSAAVVPPHFPQKKLVSRKCRLIGGARQNHNYLNCHLQSYVELNKLPVLSF